MIEEGKDTSRGTKPADEQFPNVKMPKRGFLELMLGLGAKTLIPIPKLSLLGGAPLQSMSTELDQQQFTEKLESEREEAGPFNIKFGETYIDIKQFLGIDFEKDDFDRLRYKNSGEPPEFIFTEYEAKRLGELFHLEINPYEVNRLIEKFRIWGDKLAKDFVFGTVNYGITADNIQVSE